MDKTRKNERIGYGFNRTDKALAAMNCDRMFLDFKGTRAARFDLLHHVGLRPGDVVCVVRESDLGYGVELKQIRELIEAAGATIEVAPQSHNAPVKAKTRGMADHVREVAKGYWRPGISLETANNALAYEGARRGEDPDMWGPFTRAQWKYACGSKGANR